MEDATKTKERFLDDLTAMRRRVAELEASRAEPRQSEERLRLRAECMRLATTDRLAAQVSHDINNPLASMRGCVELIKRAVPEDHPRYEFVELIDSEIDRISRTLRQMSDLYRSEPQTIVRVDVADAVGDVARLLEPVCLERRLNLETLTDESTMIVSGPDGSLRQLLYNLVMNAIEASRPDETVRVSAGMAGGNARITVADQGEGIPAERHDRLFDEAFATKGGGSSVGLAIASDIVEALRGSIDFTSEPGKGEPGKGTVFTVLLPLEVCHQ